MRSLQNGNIQQYALMIMLGVVVTLFNRVGGLRHVVITSYLFTAFVRAISVDHAHRPNRQNFSLIFSQLPILR